jgi:hypothetical protein
MKKHLIYLLIAITFFYSCGNRPPLQNFDTKLWKDDQLGCNGDREKLFETLYKQKEILYGSPEQYIYQLLGMPNSIEMEERNKKCYNYYLSNNVLCQNSKTPTRILKIEFDGLDRVRIIRLSLVK